MVQPTPYWWPVSGVCPRIRGGAARTVVMTHPFSAPATLGHDMDEVSDRVEISCTSCGAQVVVEPLERTARCPYCDSPAVVDRPATRDRPDPVFGIGFAADRKQAEGLVRAFLGSKKLAPSGLARAAAEKVEGVYVPAYLYSAVAFSSYAAHIGEDYWVTETVRDSRGRTSTRRRRKTELCELRGPHRTYLGDVLVTASRGVSNDELESVEPYRLEELQRYTPGLVAGWSAEEPSLTREECLALARRESSAKVGRLLRAFMPGDSVRGLDYRSDFELESADLTVLPLWVFAMRYAADRPPVRVLVNGQTGRVWGKVPTSWKKVGIIAAVVLGLLAVPVLLAIVAGLLQ
jgi:DNA-directed RNA polymerase subunit RPC12/RpoP